VSHQIEFRHIGLGRSRFRLHISTEAPAISFNPENLRGRNAGAIRYDIHPLA